ncbi:MAG: hypothetical protein EOO27_27715 [Comamonadaceae bacterium]|nr:MAG: hypothetical protein EOO27_27715 [Comamonadaceae bacterium]
MHDRIEIHPGVLRHMDHYQAVYTGSADALIAAGLVLSDQLPGQPGNGRGMCTYEADGSKVGKGKSTGRGPGRKYIIAKKCADGAVFEVRLNLSPERCEAIKAQARRETTCWPFPVVHGSQFLSALALEVRP